MDNLKHCDIGIVIALEEELDQLLTHTTYESEWDEITGEYYYCFSIGLGNRSYVCSANKGQVFHCVHNERPDPVI